MSAQIRILQIGSGSMGTRRMRDLTARGDVEIALVDARADRREAAGGRFGIPTFASLEEGLAWKPDGLSISTPPDRHAPFIEAALAEGLHFFCEADIWTYDYTEIERVCAAKNIVAAPSCTLNFLPITREVKRIVQEELGALHAYGMCLSVDAPAWHPGEGPEYYARHRSTAPSREMVPFELIGLEYMFGAPVAVSGTVQRRGSLEMDSEDTCCLQMTLDNGATGNLAVFMASPGGVRQGWAIGDGGFVEFNLMTGDVTRKLPKSHLNDIRNFGSLTQVLEATYAAEIDAFIAPIRGEGEWPFSYYRGAVVTGTLAAAERSALTGRVEKVDPKQGPAIVPDAYQLDCAAEIAR
jgi:predicted dehydrogenase